MGAAAAGGAAVPAGRARGAVASGYPLGGPHLAEADPRPALPPFLYWVHERTALSLEALQLAPRDHLQRGERGSMPPRLRSGSQLRRHECDSGCSRSTGRGPMSRKVPPALIALALLSGALVAPPARAACPPILLWPSSLPDAGVSDSGAAPALPLTGGCHCGSTSPAAALELGALLAGLLGWRRRRSALAPARAHPHRHRRRRQLRPGAPRRADLKEAGDSLADARGGAEWLGASRGRGHRDRQGAMVAAFPREELTDEA